MILSVHGPYQHRLRWRLQVKRKGRRPSWHPTTYETEKEALEQRARFQVRIQRDSGSWVTDAIEDYEASLVSRDLDREGIKTAIGRLRLFFQVDKFKDRVSHLTRDRGRQLVLAMEVRESRQGELLDIDKRRALAKRHKIKVSSIPDRVLSYETRRQALTTAKAFLDWAHDHGHGAAEGAFARLSAEGKTPDRVTLGVDKIKLWVRVAMALAPVSQSALAAWLAFDLGLRSTEVTCRLVGDLDDGGRVMILRNTKNGQTYRRTISKYLQPHLQALKGSRPDHEPLFLDVAGLNDPKGWLLRVTADICVQAGVPRTTPHGLRRSAANLVMQDQGVEASALAMRHGVGISRRHYLDRVTIQEAEAELVRELVTPQ